jgi:lipoprotein-releasing system ATP-binding protein
MRSINQNMNTTFLIITHDQSVAERPDRIIEIKDGKIILDVQKKP